MSRRFEITCPHCRRSYMLRSDPDNLADGPARVRCGRCRKRFRLSAAVAASKEKTSEGIAERRTYRKRISRPMMQRVDIEQTQGPGKMVDDMALAFERALQERRRSLEEGLSATEIDLPMEEDEPTSDIPEVHAQITPAERMPPTGRVPASSAAADSGAAADSSAAAASSDVPALSAVPASNLVKRITPRVFRFTPPPTAQEAIFGSNLSPGNHQAAIVDAGFDEADDDTDDDAQDVTASLTTPDASSSAGGEQAPAYGEQAPAYGEQRPRTHSSRPPRPGDRRTAPPPRPAGASQDNIAIRQAWLDFADEPLDTLIPIRSEGVGALEWLLGEDALRDA